MSSINAHKPLETYIVFLRFSMAGGHTVVPDGDASGEVLGGILSPFS